MRPGSIFETELNRIVDDRAPREQLHKKFLIEITIFRFGMAPETTVEARHALSTLALKKHYLGPVRISLSNRFRMAERWIMLGMFTGAELLEEFAKCRELMRMPRDFGVALHPSLID